MLLLFDFISIIWLVEEEEKTIEPYRNYDALDL